MIFRIDFKPIRKILSNDKHVWDGNIQKISQIYNSEISDGNKVKKGVSVAVVVWCKELYVEISVLLEVNRIKTTNFPVFDDVELENSIHVSEIWVKMNVASIFQRIF